MLSEHIYQEKRVDIKYAVVKPTIRIEYVSMSLLTRCILPLILYLSMYPYAKIPPDIGVNTKTAKFCRDTCGVTTKKYRK